jgi:NAD(P)-dependent dehydrogenase (short-subunit alcohol dehydrogenase family)
MSVQTTALVIGGAGGIGSATAGALAAQGHAVTVTGRDRAKLDAVVGRLGRGAAGIVADLSDPAAATAILREFGAAHDRLDLLVNAAGTLAVGPLESYPEATIADVLDIDLRATILSAQAALPLLRAAAARHGRALIVNIASISGKQADPMFSLYCAAKYGVVGFSHALAKELADDGIAVCALCPGLVDTKMAGWARSWADPSMMLTPGQVADAVVGLTRHAAGQVPAELVLDNFAASSWR